MYEIQKVIENGEIHYAITKKTIEGERLVESFDYNDYSDALRKLRYLNGISK